MRNDFISQLVLKSFKRAVNHGKHFFFGVSGWTFLDRFISVAHQFSISLSCGSWLINFSVIIVQRLSCQEITFSISNCVNGEQYCNFERVNTNSIQFNSVSTSSHIGIKYSNTRIARSKIC